MIGVIDYGLGNINSVKNVIDHVGGACRIVRSPSHLDGVTKIVLPGVGAFDHGMEGLREGGWIEELDVLVREKRVPVLGICLGMQLMCKSSEEGQSSGLGWIDAHARRISFPDLPRLKVPHMGWNAIEVRKSSPLFDSGMGALRFYFVHAYYVVCTNPADVVATVMHGRELTAAFSSDNIFGVQFHPEKSHRFGKSVMRRFVEMEVPCDV